MARARLVAPAAPRPAPSPCCRDTAWRRRARRCARRCGIVARRAVHCSRLALLLFPAFELAGLRPRDGGASPLAVDWSFGAGLRIVLIVAPRLRAGADDRAGGPAVRARDERRHRPRRARARANARARSDAVVQNVTTALVVGIALLMVLRAARSDIAPVLTGAGIAGLAVGFGAQTLVRDIISGFFLILEDQVRVGDVAAINGTAGSSKRSTCARSCCATPRARSTSSRTARSTRSPTAARTSRTTWSICRSRTYDDTDRVAAVLTRGRARAAGGPGVRSVDPRSRSKFSASMRSATGRWC